MYSQVKNVYFLGIFFSWSDNEFISFKCVNEVPVFVVVTEAGVADFPVVVMDVGPDVGALSVTVVPVYNNVVYKNIHYLI